MSDPGWSGEAKYRALLAVAEAANSRRDLGSVLDAVAGALAGLVPIDAIGVMTREGETIQPLAVHSRNEPRRDDESDRAYARRLIDMPGPPYEPPPTADVLDRLERNGETLVVDDVPHDPRFAEFAAVKRTGVECLVFAPLAMGQEFIGGIAFARLTSTPFQPDEVRILEEVVHEGRFRSDLYFRLNVFPIHVPPLRERVDDIPLIAEYLRAPLRPEDGEGGPRDQPGRHGAPSRVPVAGQRPRAAERGGARGDPDARRHAFRGRVSGHGDAARTR